MSKKRRKSRSTTVSQPRETVSAAAALSPAAPASRRLIHNKRVLFITGILLLLIAGTSAVLFWKFRGTEKQSVVETKTQEESPDALLQRLSSSKFDGMEKQVAEKIRSLIQQVNENPGSAYAWGKLGMNLDVHDLKKESLICYEKAAAINPDDFRWPYYKGIVLAGMGSAEAIPYFDRATKLKPGYAPAWVRSGQALFDAKKADEAAQKFQTAIELEPSSHAYVGLAGVYLSSGRLEESLSTLLEAVRLQPQHGEAHGLLSEVYRRLNRPTEAQRELWISQQLPKRTPLTDQQMGDWANEGVSSYWYDVRGRSYLQNGQYEAAVKELTMAANTTNDARIYDTLGIAYQYLKRYDEAAKYHQKALELQPNSASMLNNMASVHFEKGNLPKALEFMEKAIRAEPGFAYSYHHLGQIHLRSGNRRAAIAAYRLGNKQLPQNPQLAIQLAWLLATSSEPSFRNGKEAVQLAESAISRMPSQDPQTLIALAAAYAENGQFDRAIGAATSARQMLGTGTNELAQRLDSHIALYKQKKPYRE